MIDGREVRRVRRLSRVGAVRVQKDSYTKRELGRRRIRSVGKEKDKK